MAIFTKESLEALRQRIDLVEVLSGHVELKKTGASYKALCPFHDEKTPSFQIQKGDHHYHCFGCGAHGDAIQFLMAHQKMNFHDAVEALAQRFQISLEIVEGGQEVKGQSKTRLKEALNHACRLYHFLLLHTPEGHSALQYLYQRGLDLDFIRLFQVGLAPATPGILRKMLHENSVSEAVMVEAGLLKSATEKSGSHDFFIDRITFPIRDAAGAVIGFSARKYKEETFGGKYINTPETVLFKKSRLVFGLNYCRRRIAKIRKAIIVEGQIDALRLIQAGFNITVAGQGTAFGEGHLKELTSLGVNQVFLALDGDDAGKEATFKIGHLFQREGVEVKVVQLPSKSDPDAFLRQYGPEQFLKLLETSLDYLTFLVQYHSRQVNMESPAAKNALIEAVTKQVRSWEHPVMVHESLRKLAQLTQVPEEIVGVGQAHLPNIYIRKSASVGLQAIDPDRIIEADFLRWLLLMGESMPKIVDLAVSNVHLRQLRLPACRSIYKLYLDNHASNQPRDLLALSIQMEDSEGRELLAEILNKKVNREKALQHFEETVKKILERNWMEEREEIKRKIQSGLCTDEEASMLLKQFDEIKRKPPQLIQSML